MSKAQPIETAPKDGKDILLFVEGIWIQGRWVNDEKFPRCTDWKYEGLPSHGCGCCGSDDSPPTLWAPLP